MRLVVLEINQDLVEPRQMFGLLEHRHHYVLIYYLWFFPIFLMEHPPPFFAKLNYSVSVFV